MLSLKASPLARGEITKKGRVCLKSSRFVPSLSYGDASCQLDVARVKLALIGDTPFSWRWTSAEPWGIRANWMRGSLVGSWSTAASAREERPPLPEASVVPEQRNVPPEPARLKGRRGG